MEISIIYGLRIWFWFWHVLANIVEVWSFFTLITLKKTHCPHCRLSLIEENPWYLVEATGDTADHVDSFGTGLGMSETYWWWICLSLWSAKIFFPDMIVFYFRCLTIRNFEMNPFMPGIVLTCEHWCKGPRLFSVKRYITRMGQKKGVYYMILYVKESQLFLHSKWALVRSKGPTPQRWQKPSEGLNT